MDGVKSLLIYSPPEDDNWRETKNESTVYDVHFWTNIREGNVTFSRSQESLSVNKLLYKEFPKYLFYHFYQLRYVHIIKQGLKSISSDDFSNADFLYDLNLSQNWIAKLESHVFRSAEKLEFIDLSFNQIKHIELYAFGPSVQFLYLQNNQIAIWDFAEEPIPCTRMQLSQLYLNDNLNGNISEIFNQEACLICEFTYMTNTNISSVYIHPKTVTLEATKNHINQIVLLENSEIYQLVVLDLSYNEITSIENITKLIKLEKLDLTHNLIESFDNDTFENMTNLRELCFGNNLLKNLHLEFLTRTNNLIFLDLSYNNLEFFKLEHFASNLEELHIEGNNLTAIDTNMKRMAPKLVRLGLIDNNWECNQLTSSVLLMQLEGITPVINETITAIVPSDANNVKGIGCTVDEAKQSDENTVQVTIMNGIVLAYIDKQIEGLQQQIDEKFLELSLLNANLQTQLLANDESLKKINLHFLDITSEFKEQKQRYNNYWG